jgi:diacylglycerol kinase family enzyme
MAGAGDSTHGGDKRIHLFVINPRSFRGARDQRAVINEIHACFGPGRCQDEYHVRISGFPRAAIGIIRGFMAKLDPAATVRIYAIGGNGILFDCLNGMYDIPNTELASVPYGNSNDFIRAFGDDAEDKFKSIAGQIAAPTVPTDIILTGTGVAILNFALFGVEARVRHTYAQLAGRFEEGLVISPRVMSMIYTVLTVPAMFDRRTRSRIYEVILDDEDVIREEGSINIANGPCYGGDKQPNYRAMPNDGYLDLIFLRTENLLSDLIQAPRYYRGQALNNTERFIYRRAKKIEVRCKEAVIADFDGETFFDRTTTFTVSPAAIRFVAPRGATYIPREP